MWIALLLCSVGLVVFAGCVPEQPTLPDITITNTNTNSQGGGSQPGGGASPGTCNPIASAGVALLGTGGVRTADIRIGQTITLDTTPRDAQNQIRPDSCNAATPVLWRLNPTAGICSLNNETTYTPTLTGVGVGRCEAFSQFGSITASIPVVVNVRQ
jgi:hypothetical protein